MDEESNVPTVTTVITARKKTIIFHFWRKRTN
jgi:hypothetical protein